MQMLYLGDWDLIDRDISSSLSGAIEVLEASTLQLPVVGGAKVCASLPFVLNELYISITLCLGM